MATTDDGNSELYEQLDKFIRNGQHKRALRTADESGWRASFLGGQLVAAASV